MQVCPRPAATASEAARVDHLASQTPRQGTGWLRSLISHPDFEGPILYRALVAALCPFSPSTSKTRSHAVSLVFSIHPTADPLDAASNFFLERAELVPLSLLETRLKTRATAADTSAGVGGLSGREVVLLLEAIAEAKQAPDKIQLVFFVDIAQPGGDTTVFGRAMKYTGRWTPDREELDWEARFRERLEMMREDHFEVRRRLEVSLCRKN
mgnify:CR=1 FL=1